MMQDLQLNAALQNNDIPDLDQIQNDEHEGGDQPQQMAVNDIDSNATNSIDQICKYSHKILRKYVVNGMIDLVDGPQLHNLVDARDYRIICIMEVFSQNKNEDDFLENLGLLSQVMKEGRQGAEEEKSQADLHSEFSAQEPEP